MYIGEFVGKVARGQLKKVLILGESHYGEVTSTESVVHCYWENYAENTGRARERSYRFFDYIVRTFGQDPEQHREDFWNKVYFGNYVDVPCGVRDARAQNAITKNSKQYNQSLFRFVKEEGIDCIFCFSRRVYQALPKLEGQDSTNLVDGTDAHRLEKCTYNPGQRENVNVMLDKPVTIFGLKHPSQGYSYRKYQDRVAQIIKENGLSF